MPNVAKLLFFPKPAPIHTVKQTIALSFGAETYAMTIHAQIQRVTAQPIDRLSLDFQRGRELESRKVVPAAPGTAAYILAAFYQSCRCGVQLTKRARLA
jgi:hypothetical protein